MFKRYANGIHMGLKVIGSTFHKNCENNFIAYINTFANIKYCFIYETSDMGATDHILKKISRSEVEKRTLLFSWQWMSDDVTGS